MSNDIRQPIRAGSKWVDSEVINLRKEVAKGLSSWQIARLHKRSPFAIECAVQKYKVRTPASFYKRDTIDIEDFNEPFIINGVDYTRKFELALKVIASVINGDNQAVRFGDKVYTELT